MACSGVHRHSLTLRAAAGKTWAILTPKDLLHEVLEFIIGDSAWCRTYDAVQHFLQLLVRQVLSFPSEALLQILLGDVASVVDVEMMEGESKIGLGDGLSTVDGHRQELRVVDLAVVVEVDSLENLFDFLLGHIKLVECCANFAQLESTGVVGVECTESVSELCKVEGARVHLVDKEGEGLDLEALRLAEVLDASQHLHFVLVEESWVVAGMVLLDVVRCKPGVLETLLG